MSSPLSSPTPEEGAPGAWRGRLVRVLRLEWLGQAAASLFWLCSVLVYGVSSVGDVLQLLAALSWLVANVAAIAAAEAA